MVAKHASAQHSAIVRSILTALRDRRLQHKAVGQVLGRLQVPQALQVGRLGHDVEGSHRSKNSTREAPGNKH